MSTISLSLAKGQELENYYNKLLREGQIDLP